MWKRVIAMTAGAAIASAAPARSSCDADLDADGTVGGVDLAVLLGQWGPYAPCEPIGPADLDASCAVDGLDLAMLLAAWGAECNPMSTQLAGNPLSQYPYFEYVRAFNQGAGLHIAIDPTRFSQFVGETCDVYIVAHRTAAQWSADSSLTDLTGGAQTITIIGSTIQANSFAVSGSEDVNGTQGASIGVGYDAVLDCNRNGLLDAADVIDGLHAVDETGLYIVRDTAAAGPYSVEELIYAITPWTGTPGFESENTFYPSNITELGPRPLIIVSHGNGHLYEWYDHIGNHMGSYGLVVMSHENNTEPGVFTSSTTTLEHTDAFVAQVTAPGAPSTAALAPLDDLVNVDQIMWIGHSRGGEGVAIAYDRVFDGLYDPVGWTFTDIVLVSSIAPLDGQGGSDQPGTVHGGNYHLWTGSADGDVTGCANCKVCQTFHLHDRSEQYRQSIVLQGAGHGDFHNGPGAPAWATGPCLIGFAKTHAIMRGYLLPLVKRYFEGDIPSLDFLTRQWEQFKPIGAPVAIACDPPDGAGVDVVVNMTYRDGSSAGNFVIDDFQTQPSTSVSSSGGLVALSGLVDVIEGLNDDDDLTFTWTSADLMNSITLGGLGDSTRGLTFSWIGPASITWGVIAAEQDMTDNGYLSFRAAQASRNPTTTAELADLTFDVVLRDSGGTSGRINIGAYGGGIEEPYQRPGCGVGTGWAAEHEIIRIRLTDFLNNGSGLDLCQIVAVRFEFAGAGTSPVGRINLDEITITKD